jgi:hypothetical protein
LRFHAKDLLSLARGLLFSKNGYWLGPERPPLWLYRRTAKTLGQNMKQLLLGAALAIVATAAHAQYYGTGSNPNSHIVSGYTRSNGTYVAPYVATNPNGTQRDNYNARGNVNPYTGAVGTRTPRY